MDGTKLKVLDGGVGSLLGLRYPLLDNPLWSACLLQSHPEDIKDTHSLFLEAGAEVIITASYQASVEGFCEHLKVSEIEAIDLIKRSVTLTQEARDEYVKKSAKQTDILIAGSVGPYGAYLHDNSEYYGKYVETVPADVIKEWHRPRISALLSAGVDFLAVETLPALAEAIIMMDLLKDFPQTKVWFAFACKDEEHTCYGDKFSKVVATLSPHPQVIGVGINCSAPCHVTPLLESAQHYRAEKPFIVYPNSETLKREWQLRADSSQPLVSYVEKWVGLGARWIGGCCRVTPDKIKQIKEILGNLST